MRYKKSKPLGQEPVMEDPLTVPNIQQIFEEGYTDHTEHSFTNFFVAGGSTENDPFSALPFEILDLIFVKLTLEDIPQLRQASRGCAGHVMSDAFWHSRFRRGGEFEHVFESIKYEFLCKGRWRSIFFRVKELQNHPAMVNRKRVVILAQNLLDLVDRRGQVSCSNLGYRPFLLSFLESTTPLDPLKWATATRSLLFLPGESFRHGKRCFYRLTLAVPSDITSIFVSTIDVFGQHYISGIRFEQKNGASTEVGYVHSKTEVLVTWEESRPVCVTGFQVALDGRGVRGIAIESAMGGLSNWVGEYDGIPRRRLVPPGSKRDGSTEVALLQGGFDVISIYPMNGITSDAF
ncbi:hypothetical protein V491_09036 [Pseudogymnoascus sp. VKM F-3775]|nr:hypothetical protein V491_09036 [Pseudogymnoascus sp. VKM F-3775]